MSERIIVNIGNKVDNKLNAVAKMYSAQIPHGYTMYHETDFTNYSDFIEQARTDASNAHCDFLITD